jgi:uncharacterized membrane protein YeaQ/YmgE (transglycosylase-associated protein family)
MHVIGYLVVGMVVSLLAGWLMKGRGTDYVGYSVVGLVGSFIGGMLFDSAGLTLRGQLGSFIAATSGAVILLFFIEYMKKM